MFREVSVAMVNPSTARDPEQICEQLTVTVSDAVVRSVDDI